MPYQEELIRRALEKRARAARLAGQVNDLAFSVRPEGTDGLHWRDHPRFKDQTGDMIIGFEVIGEMTTGAPDP